MYYSQSELTGVSIYLDITSPLFILNSTFIVKFYLFFFSLIPLPLEQSN